MKLYIKQRFFTLTDSFDVYGEDGQARYTVKNRLLSLLHHLTVYDQYDNIVGNVDQRFTFLLPNFDIYLQGKPVGNVSKEFSFLCPKYSISYQNWYCEGDYLGYNYEVRDGFRTVASIHKKFFAMTDTYEVEIFDDKNEMMVLMLVLAIDAAVCSGNSGD